MYHPLAKKRINISGQLAYYRKDDCRMSNDLYSYFLYCYGNSIKTRNDTIFLILFHLSLLKGPEGKAWVLSGKAAGRVLQNRGTTFLILTYDHSSEHHSKTMAHFHVFLGLHIVNYICWDTLHSFFPPLFLGNNDLWKSSVSSERNKDFLLCNSSISSFNTLMQQRHVAEFS